MARTFHISHALISPSGLFGQLPGNEFGNLLMESWVAGAEVTRFGRTWKLSRPMIAGRALWGGHLGYVREGDVSTLDWDDVEMDFVRGEAASGVVVPFLIDGNRRLVTFQLFAGKVRKNTVTGNLQALLNANERYRWVIEPVIGGISYDNWRRQMSGITKLDLVLEKPNPNWTGREEVEALVEGLECEKIKMTVAAKKDSTLNDRSTWFQQMMLHIRQGYGRAKLLGLDIYTGEVSEFTQEGQESYVNVDERIEAIDHELEASLDDLKEPQRKLAEMMGDDEEIFGELMGELEDDSPF